MSNGYCRKHRSTTGSQIRAFCTQIQKFKSDLLLNEVGGARQTSELRRNTESYSRPARKPPPSGPTQYMPQFSQCPDASAGPKARAGFMAPPVNGPATK